MICPACKTGVRLEISGSSQVYDDPAGSDRELGYDVAHGFCPECSQFIVLLRRGRYYQADLNEWDSRELRPPMTVQIIYPGPGSRPVEPELPDRYKEEFGEACATLAVSAKASAALSRRLLQRVLREKLGIQRNSLAGEIEEFVGQPGVPSHLAEAVDAVRNIGNFAAHPLKDQHTGEVVDVEPGEADWLLDVLESMFDFVFVQPQRLAKRRADLEQKLQATGKPRLKP